MPTDNDEHRDPLTPGEIVASGTPGTEAAAPAAEDESTGRIPLDLVGGVFLLAVAAVFILNAGEDYLDWIFPLTLAYASGIIGIYLVIRALLGFGDKTDTLVPVLRGRGVDVAVFCVLTGLYVGLARTVGFWIMSMVMLFAGAVYLDHERTTKRTVMAGVVALLVCIVAYVLLRRVFYVPLPKARWLPF